MKRKLIVLIFLLLSVVFDGFSQVRKTEQTYQSVALAKLASRTNHGSSRGLKVKAVVLAGLTVTDDGLFYILHLKDEKSKFEIKAAEGSFLVCTYETIGKPLKDKRNEWVDRKVNLYTQARDVGLSPFEYVAFVTKIELLGQEGEVIDTIQ
ncbi:MAG: hypothetical protein ABI791_12775 [Acidobacteriota bacterium]